MKIVNLNTGAGVKRITFPDSQPHISLLDIKQGDAVKLTCSITSTDRLFELLLCANAIHHSGAVNKTLVIPWLMGARYDRLMQPGDSFDLEVVAGLINSLQFEKVLLFDVHSEVALKLIDNSVSVSNKIMVEAYNMKNAVLICPDKGAMKKMKHYREWNNNITEVVYCEKSRDLSTGKITLKVTGPEKCLNRNCVIIDDICDGGGTFLAIAEQIKPAHLSLVVTHGIFSKGFEQLEQYFNEIIVSNSLCKTYSSGKLKCIPVDYENL